VAHEDPPLHVAPWGTFVSSEVRSDFASADVIARTTVTNEGAATATFDVEQTLFAPDGRSLVTTRLRGLALASGDTREFPSTLVVAHPQLWSLETPVLHRLVTSSALATPLWTAWDRCRDFARFVSTPTPDFFSTGNTS